MKTATIIREETVGGTTIKLIRVSRIGLADGFMVVTLRGGTRGESTILPEPAAVQKYDAKLAALAGKK